MIVFIIEKKGDFPGEHYPHCSLKEVECNINSWYANLEEKDCICDRFIKKYKYNNR